jgi:hypothetical protein
MFFAERNPPQLDFLGWPGDAATGHCHSRPAADSRLVTAIHDRPLLFMRGEPVGYGWEPGCLRSGCDRGDAIVCRVALGGDSVGLL